MSDLTVAYISKYSYPVKTGGAEISNKLLIDNIQNTKVIPVFENYSFEHITPFPLRKLAIYADILKQLNGKDVDVVVITQTNWSSLHGVFLARLLGAKLIINECGDYWRQPTSYKRSVGKRVFTLCDGITVRTRFMKDYILGFHPELGDKVRVISNSVDLRDYSYVPNTHGMDPVNGTNHTGTPLIFSFFGRLTAAKDPFKLIEIAEILRERKVSFPYQFQLYGKGHMEVELKAVIRKKDLDDVVKLMGVVHHTEVKNVITRSHSVLMPSVWEPQGRVILEAFACGRPILASGAGGMVEALKPEYPFICGSDASLYADHLIRLAHDPEYYTRICEENLIRSKEFDIRRNAPIFEKYFREIAES